MRPFETISGFAFDFLRANGNEMDPTDRLEGGRI